MTRTEWHRLIGRLSRTRQRNKPAAARGLTIRTEQLEDRVTPHAVGSAGVDVAYGVFTRAEFEALEAVMADPALGTPPPTGTPALDGGHQANALTVVLDFKDATQPNTSDIFGNTISTFDVTGYGFAAAQFDTVAAAVAAEVDEDYFSELAGTVAGPAGQDLRVDFVVGDIGTPPPNGAREYYYIQIGTAVSGPHTGALGVAGLSVVRTASGTHPSNIPNGSVVGSMFTNNIRNLGGLNPSNALTSGNLTYTTYAVSGTLSHEIGHTLSLSHINKGGSTQAVAGTSPLMGTGAIDLPNQDRISDRSFSLSGVDGENGNVARQHVQQLVDALGLHDFNDPTQVSLQSGNLALTGFGNTDDNLTVRRVNVSGVNYVRVTDPTNGVVAGFGATQVNANTVDVPILSVTGTFLVNTGAGTDTLTVDLSGGDVITAGGITFNGGESTGDDDRLVVAGYSLTTADGAADVTVAHTGPEAGSVSLAGLGTVTFAETEPLALTGSAADLVITLPAGPNANATLGDDGVGPFDGTNDAGRSALYDSTSPYSFEYTEFTNPTNSLTLNRGSASDALTVLNLVTPDLKAALNVGTSSAPFAAVTVSGPVAPAADKGFDVDAETITFGGSASDVTLSGTGSAALTATRSITFVSGSSVKAAGGDVTLKANAAGTTTGSFIGIDLDAAEVSSAAGAVQLVGVGGTTGGAQMGVRMRNAALVSGGSGAGLKTSVQGTGGPSGSGVNYGVMVSGSVITSAGGNVSVTGVGGGTAGTSPGSNVGVLVQTAVTPGEITAGGLGTVTVQGTGGADSGEFNFGVSVGSAGRIASSGGSVTVVGIGGGTGGTTRSNIGVNLNSAGVVTAAGTAAVVVQGIGGVGTDGNHGVRVSSTDSKITSGGPVTVTGTAGGSGNSNLGVTVETGAQISATGSGSVGVTGTGSPSATGVSNIGVLVSGASALIGSAGGTVAVTGTVGGGSGGFALFVSNKGTISAGGTSSVIVTADTVFVGTATGSEGTITAGGPATFLVNTAGREIVLGVADSATALGLTDAELDRVTAGAINIGNAVGGPITVSGAIDRAAGSTTAINLTTGGGIVFAGSGSLDAKGGNVSLAAGSAGAVTSGTAATDVIANSLGVTAGSGGIASAGNPLAFDVVNLSTTVPNAAQYLAEANSATITQLFNPGNAGNPLVHLVAGTFDTAGSDRIPDEVRVSVGAGASLTLGGSETVAGLLLESGTAAGASVTFAGTSAVTGDITLTKTGTGAVGATVAGAFTLPAGAHTIAVDDGEAASDLALTGAVGGAGSVVKDGAGTLTLSAAGSDYSGATTVNAGRLLVSGSIASAATVRNGATLGGTGTAGVVTVESGGGLAPGASPGALAAGSTTLAAGADFRVEVDGATAGTQYDQLVVAGTVDVTGADLVVTGGFVPAGNTTFVLISNDGGDPVVGTFAGLAEGATVLVNGVPKTITYAGGDGNDVVLAGDTTAPAVTSVVRQSPATSPTNASSVTFRVTFSEPVQNVDLNDFTANAGTVSVAAVNGSTYDVTVAGLSAFEGTLTLGFAGGQDIADPAGNALDNTTPTGANDNTYVLDHVRPAVTVNKAGGQGDPTSDPAVVFTVTFDEPVPAFAAGHVAVSVAGGTGTAAVTSVAGGPTAYTVTVTFSAGYGDVTVAVADAAVADPAGNPNTASTSTDNTVAYAPAVSVAVSQASADEDGPGTLVYTFTRTGSTAGALMVNFTSGGTAVFGTDYTVNGAGVDFAAGTIVIPDGAASAAVTVSPTDDTTVEPDEDVVLTVAAGTGYAPANGVAGTIANDDAATVSIAAASAAEGSAVVFTATLSRAADVDVTVTLTPSVGGGDTAEGDDFDGAAKTITILAGQLTGTASVGTAADAVVEGDETFTATLSGLSAGGRNVTIGTGAAAGAVTNDDATALTVENVSLAENGGAVTFTVTSSAAVEGGFKVAYATAAGSAAAGADYTAAAGTLTFAGSAGETRTFTVTILNENLVELNESFAVDLGPVSDLAGGVSAGSFVTSDTATGTITNDDSATVSIAAASAVEGSGVVFTATLSNPVDVDVTVTLTPSVGGGDTAEGDDFAAAPQVITIPAGQLAGTAAVKTAGDAVVEGDETFTVTLSGLSSSLRDVATGTGTAAGTITDNDTAVISFADATTSAAEGGTAAVGVRLTITAVGAGTPSLESAVTVDLTGAGTGADYTLPTSPTVTFPAGSPAGTKVVSVPLTDDRRFEGFEEFVLSFTGLTGTATASGTHGLGIVDNETAMLAFAAAGSGSAEGNAGSAGAPVGVTLTLTTSGTGPEGLDVAVVGRVTDAGSTATATSGTDYTAFPATDVTFNPAAGTSFAGSMAVAVLGDVVVEADESVNLALALAGGPAAVVVGTDAHALTIVNDDAATVAVMGGTAAESGALVFTVTLSNPVDVPVTVTFDTLASGTAAAGADFTAVAGQTVTFPANDAVNRTVTVTLNNDRRLEGTETVDARIGGLTAAGRPTVTLAGGGAQVVTTGSITDDETAALAFGPAGGSAPEDNAAVPVPVTLTVTAVGTGAIGLDRAVVARVADTGAGSAAAGADYTFGTPTDLTFAAGSDGASFTQTATVALIEDIVAEADEPVALGLALLADGSGGQVALAAPASRTLTIADDDGTNRTYDATTAGDYRIVRNGGTVELYLGAALVASDALGTSPIVLNGTAGDDTLTVDFSGGNPVPAGGITFNGGGQTGAPGDRLVIANGTFGTATFNHADSADGDVVLAGFGTVTYTGLEPVDMTGSTVTDLVLNLRDDATGDDTELRVAAGVLVVDSLNGAHEDDTIPLAGVTSIRVSGRAGDDVVRVHPSMSAYGGNLTIAGDAGDDAVLLNAALTLGSATVDGNLDVLTEDVTVSAAITTTAGTVGSVTLTASDVLDVGAAGAITAGGPVAITGGTQINLAAGVTTAGDPVAVSGPMRVAADVTIATAGGAVTFHGPVDDDGATSDRTLTVNAGAGAVAFNAAVGAAQPLDGLAVTAGGVTAGDIASADALTVASDTDNTLGGTLSGTGALVKQGAGTLTLSGNNTYSGGTTVSRGTLSGATDTAFGTAGVQLGDATTGANDVAVYVTNGADPANAIVVANFGATVRLGANDVAAAGPHVFLGGVTLNRSVVLVGAGDQARFDGVISGTGNVTVARGAAAQAAGELGRVTLTNTNTFTGAVSVQPQAVLQLGNAADNALPDAAAVDVAADGRLWLAFASETIGSLAGSGLVTTLAADTATRTLAVGGGAFAGVLADESAAGGGRLNLVKQGPGTLVLTGANTYTGTTTVSAGTLQVGAGGASGRLGTGTVTNDAALVFDRADALAVVNAVGGTGTLTQAGAGTTTLTGTNTYSGTTTVSAGTLLVNGTNAGTGAVTVTGAAVLGGTGSIAGAVSLTGAARLAPGASPETLATGPVNFTAGTVFDVEIGGTSPGNGTTGYDQLVVTGSVTLGNATLNLTSFGGFAVDAGVLQTFVVIDNDGSADAVSGTFAGLPEGSAVTVAGLGTLYVSYAGGDGNDVVLSGQPLVQGTALDDTFTVTGDGTTFTVTRANANGTVTAVFTGPAGPLNILGGGGGDLIIVDGTGASTDPLPAGGVVYDGQEADPTALDDVLRLLGTSAQTATYLPSATTPGSGQVTVAGLGGVTFATLGPVDLIGYGTANVNLPNADDAVTVAAGFDAATGGDAALVVSGTSGGVAFGPAHLRGNTTVVIHTAAGGTDGSDGVTVTSAAGDHDNTNLTIHTGTAGTDAVGVTGPVSVTGTVSVAANGTISGAGAITAAVLATNSGGGTSLTGANQVASFSAANASSGNIHLTNAAGPLTIGDISQSGGNVTVTNAGGITLAGNVAAGSGAIILTATGAITQTAGALSTTGTLTTTSAGGTALPGANQVAGFNATNTAGGDVSLTNAAGLLSVTGVSQSGGGNVAVGNTGSVTLAGPVSAAGGNVTLTADGAGSTIADAAAGDDNATDVSGNVITLTATAGVGTGTSSLDTAAASLDVSVAAAGNIHLREADAVTLSAVDTADGSIRITAGGSISVTDVRSATDTDANDITVIAAGDITVGLVRVGASAAAVAGDVTLTAALGAIRDGLGDAAADVVGDLVTLTAATGVGGGAGGTLDTAANALDVSVTGAGGIDVDESDLVTLTAVDTADGNVGVTAAGTITVNRVAAGGVKAVRLTAAAGGDIRFAGLGAAAGGDVRLDAAGAITDDTDHEQPAVGAHYLALVAGAGIGMGDDLDVSAVFLAFSNTSGAVNVSVSGGVAISPVGSLQVSSNNGTTTAITATGPLVVVTQLIGTGHVSLTATDDPDRWNYLTIGGIGGAMVRSTAAGVTLSIGDNLYVQDGSTVSAAHGVQIILNAGMADGVGDAAIGGTIVSGTGAVIIGSPTGNSTVTLGLTVGADVTGAGLAFNAAGAGNVLHFDAAGRAAPLSVTVDGSAGAVTGATTQPITFNAGVQTVGVVGGAAADTFSVTPSATAAVMIEGNDPAPPAGPGDSLLVITSGASGAALTSSATPAGLAGAYTFADRGAVTFAEVETLGATADLTVTTTNTATTAVPGTTVTYTVVVTNTGAVGVTGVTVTDVVPAALTNVTWSAAFSAGSGGAAGGTGNINEVITLAAGGTATYTLTGTVAPAATGSLTNTATVVAPAGVTDPGPNTATDTDTLTPTVDVVVTKSDGQSAAVPGTAVTYTVVVTNAGPSTAAGVVVADAVPPELTGVTWTSSAAGGASGNTPQGAGGVADALTLPPGASVTYTITGTVRPDAAGALASTAAATVPAGTTDTNPANNTATDTDALAPTVDVSVTKSDGLESATAGTTIAYTVVVTNAGPSTAAGVSFADPVAVGLTAVTWVSAAAGGATGNAAAGTGAIADVLTLPPGGSVTYTVTATVAAGFSSALSNTATAAVAAGTTDTNPANNAATDATAVPAPPPPVVVPPAPQPALAGGPPDGTARPLTPSGGGYALADARPFFDGLGVNVRVATADVTGDGVADFVGGTGPGAATQVVVVDGATGSVIAALRPFEPTFAGGVFVAAADIDGDGKAEVIVTPDQGGGPVVAVYGGAGLTAGRNDEAQLTRFFGIEDPTFRGGARPAAGDVTGDGKADVVLSAGFLGGPRIALFDGATLFAPLAPGQLPPKLVGDFFAFEDGLRNGAFVAVGDVTGDGRADLAFGGGPGGGPRVRLFDGAKLLAAGGFATLDDVPAAQAANFFAGGDAPRGGVRVALRDADGGGRADLIAGTGEGEPSRVRVYLSANLLANVAPSPDQEFDPFGALLTNGVFVG